MKKRLGRPIFEIRLKWLLKRTLAIRGNITAKLVFNLISLESVDEHSFCPIFKPSRSQCL